jgi:hypothetical protein
MVIPATIDTIATAHSIAPRIGIIPIIDRISSLSALSPIPIPFKSTPNDSALALL